MNAPITAENLTDEQIANLAAKAIRSGDERLAKLCAASQATTTRAADVLRSLGHVFRANVTCGVGPSRTGWWRVTEGGRPDLFLGRSSVEVARNLCADAINAARAQVAS